jgi:hypothetical protein
MPAQAEYDVSTPGRNDCKMPWSMVLLWQL